MIIFLSGNLVSQSIRNEFGDIPIHAIPLANKALIQHQVTAARLSFPNEDIWLLTSKKYNFLETDLEWLIKNKVSIHGLECNSEPGIQLAEFLSYQKIEESERLLFNDGSTLLEYKDLAGSDWKVLYETDCEPDLPVISYGLGKDLVWSGVACVKNARLFAKILYEENCDILRALTLYEFKEDIIDRTLSSVLSVSNISSYLAARTKITSERAFNDIKIYKSRLSKTSRNQTKIEAESAWFASLPNDFKHHCPQYLGLTNDLKGISYEIEYLPSTPLNEIYVHGNQTVVYWDKVFLKLQDIFSDSRKSIENTDVKVDSNSKKSLFIEKTKLRLKEFSSQVNLPLDREIIFNGMKLPSINSIVIELEDHLDAMHDVYGIIHGDLCFSNILLDSRLKTLKLIDPRGIDSEGNLMLFGSQLYDYSKLVHSVLGLYDFIMSGHYSLSSNFPNIDFEIFTHNDIQDIQSRFCEYEMVPFVQTRDAEKLSILLFFSMLPLHADNVERQFALLANGLRIYSKFN